MRSCDLEILVAVCFLLIALVAMLGISIVRDALKRRDKIANLATGSRRYERNPRTLWGLVLLA